METTEHIFVPKHIKLSEDEAKKVLERHNIKAAQLPRIKKEDPAIKGLGAKADDIIKILRKSPTMLDVEFFRLVVEE